MPKRKKRFAQVGLGGRSRMYRDAVVGTFKRHCELVGLCDVNPGRLRLSAGEVAEAYPKLPPVPTYAAEDFDKMVAETKPDVIIVTTGPDVTHAE